jgi:hypothetical protein
LARLGKEVFQHTGFASAALSGALGKDGIRHAALKRGAAADRFRREVLRLEGVRKADVMKDTGSRTND